MTAKDRTDYWRQRTEARRAARAAERGPRTCATCGKTIPAEAHGKARYCSRECRDKAFYLAHAQERIKAVARAHKARADDRRKWMREYMARRRKAAKGAK